jgi:MYXO-CTERM domain-containing protein
MYSPTAVESGSSVSHWDTSAFPNLLMEPIINGDLTHSLDLTTAVLHDIGWTLSDGGTVDGGACVIPGGGGADGGGGGGGGAGGGGGGTSGCTTALGSPAPWLALIGLLALVRRRRRAHAAPM